MIHPTREQTWLLRACLLSGRDTAEAWDAWRRLVKFDEMDAASHRLVPLLHRNLRRQNIQDELLGRIQGIHRFNWSRNQLLFRAATSVMTQLQAANIPFLVLKGAALAAAFYEDPGERPMDDFDFMVRLDDVPRAAEILAHNGWYWKESFPRAEALAWYHAGHWTNDRWEMIDLHWRLRPEGRQPAIDEPVWSQTANVTICGHSFPTLNPADLLWHACMHGMLSTTATHIRWVADAWIVLKKTPQLDWDRFVGTVQRRGLTVPITEALEYLRTQFAAPVPPDVIQRLAATRVSRVERWAYGVKTSPPGATGALPMYLANHYVRTRGLSWWQRLVTLPAFFRHAWGLSSLWHFPGSFLKRAWKRLGRRAG